MDSGQLFPTSEGTPQVISIKHCLHGWKKESSNCGNAKGNKHDNRCSLSLIRYADDLIMHEDITVVQRCREIISEWLKDMGLELKPPKTRLTHTLNNCGEENRDLISSDSKHWKVGKYHSKRGQKTIITPSKEKQKIQAASIIEDHKSAPQKANHWLNPIIMGWSNYYSAMSSKSTTLI